MSTSLMNLPSRPPLPPRDTSVAQLPAELGNPIFKDCKPRERPPFVRAIINICKDDEYVDPTHLTGLALCFQSGGVYLESNLHLLTLVMFAELLHAEHIKILRDEHGVATPAEKLEEKAITAVDEIIDEWNKRVEKAQPNKQAKDARHKSSMPDSHESHQKTDDKRTSLDEDSFSVASKDSGDSANSEPTLPVRKDAFPFCITSLALEPMGSDYRDRHRKDHGEFKVMLGIDRVRRILSQRTETIPIPVTKRLDLGMGQNASPNEASFEIARAEIAESRRVWKRDLFDVKDSNQHALLALLLTRLPNLRELKFSEWLHDKQDFSELLARIAVQFRFDEREKLQRQRSLGSSCFAGFL